MKRRRAIIYAVVLAVVAILAIHYHLASYEVSFVSYTDHSGIHTSFQLLNGAESCGLYHVSKGDVARLVVKLSSGKLKVDVALLGGGNIYSSTFSTSENVSIPINESGFVVLKLVGDMASGSVDLTFEHPQSS